MAHISDELNANSSGSNLLPTAEPEEEFQRSLQQHDTTDSRITSPSGGDDSQGLERPESTESCTSDESVAVNCSAMPAEVVVQGRRVQTVRVLFTPQPPPAKVSSSVERRQRSSRRLVPLARSGTGRSGLLSTQVTDGNLSPLPLPTEETLTEDVPGIPRIRSVPQTSGHLNAEMTRVTSLPEPLAASGHPVYFSAQTPNADDESSLISIGAGGGVDDELLSGETDRRVQQDIRNGLNLLERRKEALRVANLALKRENESIRLENEEIKRRLQIAESENDELKAQVDKLDKETMQASEKARDEWKLRVGAEERYVEEKRRGEDQIRRLKEELDRKNAEIKLMENLMHNNNNDRRDNNGSAGEDADKLNGHELNVARRGDRELLQRIYDLETTIAAVQTERNRLAAEVVQLNTDATAWRERFEAKCSEYDVQLTKFDALCLRLNLLQAENRNLRGQYVQVRQTAASAKSSLDAGSGSPTGGWSKGESKMTSLPSASGAQLHHVQLPAAGPCGNVSLIIKNRSGSKDAASTSTTQLFVNQRGGANQMQHQQPLQQQRRRKSMDLASGSNCSIVESLPPVNQMQNHAATTKPPK